MKSITLIRQSLNRIPGKGNLLVALILFLLVWFVLPHMAIGGKYPFLYRGVRIFIFGLIALCWIIGWIIKLTFTQIQTHKHKVISVFVERIREGMNQFKRFLINAWNYGKTNLKEIKHRVTQDRHKRLLRNLPWYVILGSPQSGKKSLISNLGLYYAQPKHFGEEAESYINQFPDYDWWFSEQAVLIDAMGPIDDSRPQSWKRFIKLLKRQRWNKPVNGIILTFCLSDVLLYSNQDRHEFIQEVCLYVREIHETFKSQVPVYIVFTKSDLVEGFMEFFSDLSKEELHQIWGMTIPVARCDDVTQVLSFFSDEYTALVNKLQSQVLWALESERNPRGRELIHSFPQQMQLFKRPIENFISELFSAVRYPKALQVRGLYFTSSHQEGEPNDFLLQAMSKKFQLVPPVVLRPKRMGECYFLRRLFYDVIYPEALILGESERSRKIRKWSYHSIRIGAPTVVILAALGMHQGYKENLVKLKILDHHVTRFEQLDVKLDSARSLTVMLPLLNELNSANFLYQNQLPFAMKLLYETGSIHRTIDKTLNRILTNLFIPRVAAQIEVSLNQNIEDQNLLYATLKGYLAFSANDSTEEDAIKPPMEYTWSKKYLNNPDKVKQLRYYLQLALKKHVTKLPLDNQLIIRIRSKLEQIIPSQRAYGLLQLKASVGELPPLLLSSAVGNHFNEVFITADPKLSIPALYTKQGFEQIFLRQYRAIAHEVAQDNQDVGLSHENYGSQSLPQVVRAMQETYQERYIKNWMAALTKIDIVKFNHLTHAIAVLNLLISRESPLARLFNVITNNTSTITSDSIQVNQKFKAINDFGDGGSKLSWQQTEKSLTTLRDYLVRIEQSPDHNKASYDAAVETIQNGKSAIQILTLQAQKAPKPIKKWLMSIANNSWEVVVQGAHDELNIAWQKKVMIRYNANLRGRYPISVHSDSEVSIRDFDQFFGNSGILDNYFNHYLKPFVKTNESSWRAYVVHGHSIEIPESHILLFQRAKRIQQDYFPRGSQSSKLLLSVKPLTLDAKASTINFIIGNKTISYSHGPQRITVLEWPLPQSTDQTELVLSAFSGRQFAKSAHGAWSLFKILDQGDFRQHHLGSYIYSVSLHGHTASYEFFGSSNRNIYKLTALKGYVLPNEIAP